MARAFDPLLLLRPLDRKRLLRTDNEHLLGPVMEFNRTERYHCRLDSLQLVSKILRHRKNHTG